MNMNDALSRIYYLVDTPAYDLGAEVPAWIQDDITASQVAAIIQNGCSAHNYPLAVDHKQALETMARYGDEVIQYIAECTGGVEVIGIESWGGTACYFVATAVELWCDNAAREMAEHAPPAECDE